MRILSLIVLLCAAQVALAANTPEKGERVRLHEHPTILDMLRKNNAHREVRGYVPHRINPELCKAAQNHAEYMAAGGEFSHYANGGYQGRATKFGYRGSVRENIAWGQQGVVSAFNDWINSSGHYASIMSDTADAGFGLAYSKDGSPYWVGVYGYPEKPEKKAVTQATHLDDDAGPETE